MNFIYLINKLKDLNYHFLRNLNMIKIENNKIKNIYITFSSCLQVCLHLFPVVENFLCILIVCYQCVIFVFFRKLFNYIDEFFLSCTN